MSLSVNYAGNGNFTIEVNGKSQTFNLADLNMMLRIEQVAQYDQGIADQLSEIKQTNTKRKALNVLLSKMRDAKSKNKDSDVNHSDIKFELEGYGDKPKSFAEWAVVFGFELTPATGKDDKKSEAWDANINAVKGLVDNVTSDSEMQMLRFRQMVDKRGTALQEAKTTLSNDKRLKDAIIQG